MRVELVLVTHGGNLNLIAAVLASFASKVTPNPTSGLCIHDGVPDPDLLPLLRDALPGLPWRLSASERPRGFCSTTGRGWQETASCDADYVYWLEHDFLHVRPVDLAELARPLDADPLLAQMSLMRQAVNEVEVLSGGLYESRQGSYVRRGDPPAEWLAHRGYFTTNPSLLRRSFIAEHPWPPYPRECEGRFGIDLVAAGYRFGVWGTGEPWVEHVGARTGFGY